MVCFVVVLFVCFFCYCVFAELRFESLLISLVQKVSMFLYIISIQVLFPHLSQVDGSISATDGPKPRLASGHPVFPGFPRQRVVLLGRVDAEIENPRGQVESRRRGGADGQSILRSVPQKMLQPYGSRCDFLLLLLLLLFRFSVVLIRCVVVSP